VARQLHCDRLRDASAHEVANGGASQIVRNAAWAAGRLARLLHSFSKPYNGAQLLLAAAFVSHHAPEHVGADVTGFLQLLVLGQLVLQQRAQRRRERERAALLVLRRSRL
jgi:hypothetical protein